MTDRIWLRDNTWCWCRAEEGFPYEPHTRDRVQHWAERRVHTSLFKKYTTPFFSTTPSGLLIKDYEGNRHDDMLPTPVDISALQAFADDHEPSEEERQQRFAKQLEEANAWFAEQHLTDAITSWEPSEVVRQHMRLQRIAIGEECSEEEICWQYQLAFELRDHLAFSKTELGLCTATRLELEWKDAKQQPIA